jgi:pimeloyl-ACP methyl ester carboxylesterase
MSLFTPDSTSNGHAERSPKPTIVLVHGAWADASGWNQEITNLERCSYSVIAPANPLRALASDAAYIRSVLQTVTGPIVLEITDQRQATQRSFSSEAFGSLSGEPAWKSIRSWYMLATQDRAIPPATQRFMAGRMYAAVVEVDASHVAMMSQPEATTSLIVEAAEAIQ